MIAKIFFCSCNCGAGTHCGVIYRLWTKKCKVVCRSVLDRFLLHCGLVGMVLDIFLVTTKTVSMSAICLKATRSQSQIKSQRKEKRWIRIRKVYIPGRVLSYLLSLAIFEVIGLWKNLNEELEPHCKHNCEFNFTTGITQHFTTTTYNKDPSTALSVAVQESLFAIGNLVETLACLHLWMATRIQFLSERRVIFWQKFFEYFYFLLTSLQGVHGLSSGLSFCHWTFIHRLFFRF